MQEKLFKEKNANNTKTDGQKCPPASLTLSFFDLERSLYGFTYNTKKELITPVLLIEEGEILTEKSEKYPCSLGKSSPDKNGDVFYIAKAEATLKPDTVYTYKICDENARVYSETATFKTKNHKKEAFRFSHISDSQTSGGLITGREDGRYFERVLQNIVRDSDFILHTGDIVDSSEYGQCWIDMFSHNFKYVSRLPIMALSGNHETVYHGHENALFDHFNNKIPCQESTAYGYFYSFTYGDVKFIMLNNYNPISRGLEDEQYEWLVSELEKNTCNFTVVGMHNPMYSIGKYGSDPNRNKMALLLRSQLEALFYKHGVDIVLSGHDHAISRTYPIREGTPESEIIEIEDGVSYSVDPDGVIYLMNGGGGEDLRSIFAIDESIYAYAEQGKRSSWADFDIEEDKMTVTVKYSDGENTYTYCKWGIKKTKKRREE